MKFEGEVVIPAPRQVVWQNLMNEVVLMECVPGLEALERLADDRFAAEGRARIGPVDAVLKGELRLENVVPEHSYTLIGQGKGAVGFVKARADVALHDEDGGRATRLVYSLEAKIGGRLAQVGSRLLSGAAQKYADAFFSRFTELVKESAPHEEPKEEAGTPAADRDGAAAAEAEAGHGEPSPPKTAGADIEDTGGLPAWIWVPALILVILGLLYLWS
ncbi:MAG: carbon monoxide dehydrogenase [Alphaproteobacteria bacterium]|nr:MAG: carbon monoxide dehydrogenase [Alphaproteobacteria bacterium]